MSDEPLASLVEQWLQKFPATQLSAQTPDSDAYLVALRRCVTALRGEPDVATPNVRIDIVHLDIEGEGTSTFTVLPVSGPASATGPLDCPACPILPGNLAFQHFVAVARSEDDGLVLFVPPGAVVLPQRFALGFRLLATALPDTPRMRVASTPSPAKLLRKRQLGARVFTVVSKMKFVVVAEPEH